MTKQDQLSHYEFLSSLKEYIRGPEHTGTGA